MSDTKYKIFFYLLPLLMLACTLTAQSAANVAMPMPEQTQTAQPTQTSALSLPPALNGCQVKTGIESGALNLRTCGGVTCLVLVVLHEGETVTQTEAQAVNDWFEVITANGLTGWVNSNFLDCRR